MKCKPIIPIKKADKRVVKELVKTGILYKGSDKKFHVKEK